MIAQSSSLSLVKNRHLGETGVLLCNGPSLNHVEFGLIRQYPVIGLNKIYLAFARFRIYPRYYIAINKLVIQQGLSEIAGIQCIKFLPFEICDQLQWVPPLSFLLKTKMPQEHFYTNIQAGVNEGSTVTYVALQIAYYMGFKRIVIVGMDHNYKFSGMPHDESMLVGDDPNHFDAKYFSGMPWNNPDLSTSEESYRVARWRYECDGREIIDATQSGMCNIFEKMSLKDALECTLWY
jgi:hypothetical protein